MGKSRSRSNNQSQQQQSNGGILGSGIFGGFGSNVHCNANDNSFFCTMTKIVNLIMMFFFIIFVLYILYVAYKYFVKGKKTMFGGSGCRSYY